jgi:hypothetical protein
LPNQIFICWQDQNSDRKVKLIARVNGISRRWLRDLACSPNRGIDCFWRRKVRRLEPSRSPNFAAETLDALASLRCPGFQVQLAAPHQPPGDVGRLQRSAFGR